MVDPVRPVLRGDSPAAQVFRDLALGPGERVGATVLSDLGGGVHEVRLGGRVLRVQSPQRLEAGDSLVLAVREVRSRLALEILEIRPAAPPGAPEAARLSALGLPDTPELRDALRAVLDAGLPVSRAALETALAAGRDFPAAEALARRAAAFLMAAGVQPPLDALPGLMEAVMGGSLGAAVSALEGLEGSPEAGDLARRLLHDLGWKGSGWSASGTAEQARVLAAIEEGLARLLAADPRLKAIDRAMEALKTAPSGLETKEAEAAAKALLARPGEAAGLPAGTDPAAVATVLARWEREALDTLPWLRPLREAYQALARSRGAEEGRLLLGRDGARYAEGVYRPPGGDSAPMRLRVAGRHGGDEARKGPLKVAIGLTLSALGGVGADLEAEDHRLRVALKAERPDAEGILKEGAPDLAASLKTIGFEASVSVRRVEPEGLEAGFYPELGGGNEPPPLVDLKA